MKYLKIVTILLLSLTTSFYSCNDNAKGGKQEILKSNEGLESGKSLNVATPSPVSVEPSQNAQGVWHYRCSKGCEGGAGTAVNCNTCGTLLVHNSAYHANSSKTPMSSAPFATPPTSEPSRNAAGVWHYSCGNGCGGGSGTSGNCGTCGSALAHNAAYHQ
ncbi:MAG: hypothetical protein ABJM36_04245 [Algibacter sp.]|uniref:hypothetical protein n=1 Tax=Algibacter sp. TaxID=1872428 RepID=UPI0032976DF1